MTGIWTRERFLAKYVELLGNPKALARFMSAIACPKKPAGAKWRLVWKKV